MSVYEEYRRVMFGENELSPQGRSWLRKTFRCGRDAASLRGLDRAILHLLADHFPNRAPTMRMIHRELEMCFEEVRDRTAPSTLIRGAVQRIRA